MGTCCSSRQLPAEDFIQALMFETKLLKYDYYEIEKIFLEKTISTQLVEHISKNQFDEIFKKFYSIKKNENYEFCINNSLYLKKVFEDVVFTDDNERINIFHILLAIFSLIGHENKCQLKEFYQLLLYGYKVYDQECRKNKIPFDFLKKSIRTYLEINLIVITNSVYNTMILNGLEDCQKFDLEHLVKQVYTEDKMNKFYQQKFEKEIQWINWKENKKLGEDEIIKLFKNKEYIFSFWKLRNSFLEFYKNNFLNDEHENEGMGDIVKG
jgi:hypothetical protein